MHFYVLIEVLHIKAIKRWKSLRVEGKKIQQSPSAGLYNTIWHLISADANADSSVKSLVAIPAPDHQWIPAVILSSLLTEEYFSSVSLTNLLPLSQFHL